jgi:hypothetical protein
MFNSVGFDGIKGIEIVAFNSMRLHGIGLIPSKSQGLGLKWWHSTTLENSNPFDFEVIKLVEFGQFSLMWWNSTTIKSDFNGNEFVRFRPF